MQVSVFAEELLFDGTIADYKTAVIKPEVKAIFESQVFPQAKKHFAEIDTNDCQDKLEIFDGAAMQVSENYSEKFFLYNFCGQPYQESYQGFVITKNGAIKAHYVFNTFDLQFTNIFYRNGLIILLGEGTKFQSDWRTIVAIDYVNDDLKQTVFTAYSNECREDGSRCVLTAQKIYYEPIDGSTIYWTEGYKKQGGKWVKVKNRKPFDEDNEESREVLLDWKKL